MNVQNLSTRAKSFFNMIEFDDNEELVWEIRKDPFGLFLIYFTGAAISAVIFSVLVLGALLFDTDFLGLGIELGSLRPIIIAIGFFLTVFSLVGTAIGAYLYQSNVVLITSEKVAQLLYKTIFDRKISQLSIGDVQDVTVTQKGVLARIFKYGTLVIETAGEQANYNFTFTPDPYETAKAIVGAHEENLKKYGN
ncbi:PH domain-containing protein [Candidatus Saccharibacteria bacterium]|nr:PH domain-containing protein [Candidatus Saccharibacteria bacterium]